MMVSSPYLATAHADPCGTSPLFLSSPMNCHDLVVCSLRPRFGNTDSTPGYSETWTQRWHGWQIDEMAFHVSTEKETKGGVKKKKKKKVQWRLTGDLGCLGRLHVGGESVDAAGVRVGDGLACLLPAATRTYVHFFLA
jgi:hypothetical protein